MAGLQFFVRFIARALIIAGAFC